MRGRLMADVNEPNKEKLNKIRTNTKRTQTISFRIHKTQKKLL